MTLHAIVAALGGDLYQGGCRASIPAPGHSVADRSVSLLLAEGRIIIHGFGAADWRSIRDHLRDAGFIDADGRLTGGGAPGPSAAPRPDRRLRLEMALRLWDGTLALQQGDPASLYLRRRAVTGRNAGDLRFHPRAPVSVHRAGRRTRPALVSGIRDADGRLSAVELTYLEPNGKPAAGLVLTRKTVGLVPPGAAVRLSPAAAEMVVGEGVFTTLSAIDRFRLPGWALMSANNLAAWTPPPEVRRVLIAADRGAVGEAAAGRLCARLRSQGAETRILRPEAPFDDWNAVALDRSKGGREGAEGGRSGGDGPRSPAGDAS